MTTGLIALVVVLVVGWWWMNRPARGVEQLAAETLETWKKQEKGRLIVDVREAHEFRSGHVPGAVNVPLSRLSRELHRIPKDREVALICRSGHRSVQAARILKKAGYTRLWNVRGGMIAWNRRPHQKRSR
ncbi:rhodanese-like domain-containing protein [Kyrpidia sp.]|uniref:rhodanese-like domain-containing protein n=1 Tax=Kyrpidia sp. TaxID=2073077 RepID=UPI00258E87B9|nr:rhodanese-like domain-containing protein [Kyrpidia sp.]